MIYLSEIIRFSQGHDYKPDIEYRGTDYDLKMIDIINVEIYEAIINGDNSPIGVTVTNDTITHYKKTVPISYIDRIDWDSIRSKIQESNPEWDVDLEYYEHNGLMYLHCTRILKGE